VATADLVGRWRLTSYIARDPDGSVRRPFGEHPEGILIYTAGGWMVAHIAAENRARLTNENMLETTESERADAFVSYLAYSGGYEIEGGTEGGTVTHRVAMCSFPNWVGTVQTRQFELKQDELILRTPPLDIVGPEVVHEFHWVRVDRS
jgi:Lipocalin-like domain